MDIGETVLIGFALFSPFYLGALALFVLRRLHVRTE